MNKIKERMQSDRAASNTVEVIIIIALAVFAALALFTFVLRPVQDSAEGLGGGLKDFMEGLFKNDGKDATFELKPPVKK